MLTEKSGSETLLKPNHSLELDTAYRQVLRARVSSTNQTVAIDEDRSKTTRQHIKDARGVDNLNHCALVWLRLVCRFLAGSQVALESMPARFRASAPS